MIYINKQLVNTVNRLPLTSDYVFKRIFAKESNHDILKDFLEAILKVKIKNVIVKNPEIPKNIADEKVGILDLKVELDNQYIIDIEMQVTNEKNINLRSTIYLSKLVAEQLTVAEPYQHLKKTIVINLLNFKFFNRNSYHSIAHMKFENTTKEEYVNMGYLHEDDKVTDCIEMHFIEIPKFLIKNPGMHSKLEQWMWTIIGKEEKVKMAKKENDKIEKAIEELDVLSMDKKEREMYEWRKKAIMDYNSQMYASMEEGLREGKEEGRKKGREEGIKEGREEGIKEGREEGIKEGREEGREEGIKEGREEGIRESKKEIARKLFNSKMPFDMIQEITELSEQELREIEASINT